MSEFKAWNVGSMKRKIIQVLAMGRTMIVLALLSIILFVILGVGGLAEQRLNTSPVSSMKGLASSLSGGLFAEMLGMEVPHLKPTETEGTAVISAENMSNFVFQLLTNVNPADPKSLVAREVPGLGSGGPVLLRGSAGGNPPTAPEDYRSNQGVQGSGDKQNGVEPDPGNNSSPDKSGQTDIEQDHTDKPQKEESSNGGANSGQTHQSADDEVKTVMIYHSHPHEAYNPLTGTDNDNPSSADQSKNVGVVGDFVAQELEKKGVGAYHTFEDYMSKVQGYNYNYSYKYSRVTIKDALAEYQSLHYFIDIHRDSQSYKKTTTTINGVSYAQVYFIIGHANPDWRKNEAFANRIYEGMEKKYPGLSRGIWGKTTAQGNGEYNQSLSPNSVLIEIGGIDNTKEELQRTSKILADMIADVYFEDQKAEKASKDKTEKSDKPAAPEAKPVGKKTVKSTDSSNTTHL